ncbi:hypothetical protein QBC45DRAFT_224642 [Copromyces sp. CBS 386.78]|nr:hypothetical protein QBC45DRAFT_224642 [Copromyces sp. CBS 386.78]
MAAVQYSAEFLLYLRASPLCVKPPGLPPAEEWMGPPPETGRNSQAKTTNDRIKGGDSFLLNQENRRPALDRNGSRTTTNPEDIILGPPRTSFASATTLRNNRTSDADKGLKDNDRQDRTDRFNFRTRTNDPESTNDRFGNGRNSAFRRRGEDQDNGEGWTPVKPRKSFGTEGAERFQGRMGAAGERFGSSRDTQAKDVSDRRNRAQDIRDKDGEDIDTPRRNGLSRGKTDSWFNKENTNSNDNNAASLSVRERIDRSKSWRDREPNEDRQNQNDRYGDRAGGYGGGRYDRDRDQRVERDPEWLDEPVEHKSQGHTAEDFKKFMESMKSKHGGGPKAEDKAPAPLQTNLPEPAFEAEKVLSAPALETGPDKFFAAYGGSLQVSTPTAEKEASKPTSGKGSRFMAFLAPQEGAKTEPSTPAATAPSGGQPNEVPQKNEAEKEAFNLLIQKLQKSGMGGPSGPSGQAANPMAQLFGNFSQPAHPADSQPKSQVASPEPFQQYGGDRRDDPRFRAPPPNPLHDILSPRPMAPPTQPPPMTRPEQALHDILAQRHAMPNHGNNRGGQNPMVTDQAEFLMRLMQNHEKVPEPRRQEHPQVRMPQPTKQVNIPDLAEREAEYQRERIAAQRQQQQQQIRGPAPPGFFNDQFHPSDVDNRPPQPPTQMPTQILQRPPPPGLDHHMLPFPLGAGGAGNPGSGVGGQPMGPPQRGPMIPPPGLVNGPRNGPMPGMFPMNFPPPGGAFPPGPPPPDGLVGPPPPRGMQPPPGFFGGGPPPGFMGPPPGMGGFQGPDGPAGFGGAGGLPFPVDRRGMLPPGYRGP